MDFPFEAELVRDEEHGVILRAEGLPRSADMEISGKNYKITFYETKITAECDGKLYEMTITQFFDRLCEDEWGWK